MGIGKKTGGRDFVKGDPRRINKPKMEPGLKEARQRTALQVAEDFNRIMGMNKAELLALANDPKAPSFEVICARIVTKSASKADERAFEFLLNRAVGKVKDVVVHQGSGRLSNLSKEEIMEAFKYVCEKRSKEDEPK